MRTTLATAALLLAACGAAAQTPFPADNEKSACVDSPLRLTFASPPKRGQGKIHVIDVATKQTVDEIDLAQETRKFTLGGLDNYNLYTAFIDGNTATIPLPADALKPGHAYAVTVDAGAFEGQPALSWRFATKAAAPADAKRIVVSSDGTGDFATVQGAVDSVPENNADPATIFIRSGTYHEIVAFTGKDNLTILGENRKKTVIAYPNNDKFNNGSHGNPFADKAGPPASANPRKGGAIYRRGMFLAHRVKNLTLANLTLHNTTPVGGSQAEAIILNGTQDAHAILTHVDLYSFQDTLQINGQAYVADCHIQGDVDFMWGSGPCFFERCTATSTRSKAYYTQIRNPPTNHGYVYKDCTFDGTDGIADNFLCRIDPSRFTACEVVLLNCTLTPAVGAVAWKFDKSADPAQVRYWEFNSHAEDGKPVETAQRLAGSRQLTLPADKETIDNYSTPSFVLNGWTPEIPKDLIPK